MGTMPSGARTPPGELTTEIIALLRAHIARINWPYNSVAEAADVKQSTFSKLINGHAPVDVEQLDRICWSVSYPMEQLVHDAEQAVGNRQTKKTWPAKRLPMPPR